MNFIQKIKKLFGFDKTMGRTPDPDNHIDKPSEKQRDFSSGSPRTGSSSPLQARPREPFDPTILGR
jgi:hypothetical protein